MRRVAGAREWQESPRDLFALQRVLDATDSILDLAFNLIRLAFGVQLGVTDNLADSLFHFAFHDFRRADYTIFVHDKSLSEKRTAGLPRVLYTG